MEHLLHVAGVGLCTVVDEYLIRAEMNAARQEIVFHDGLAQEVIALFRPIAVESLGSSHLIHGAVHGLNDSRTERLRDVADTKRDDVGFGVHHLEGVDLLGNVGEQVVVL